MRVFLITGASIGVVGTLAGCVLGILFCWRIDEIRQFVAWLTSTSLFDPDDLLPDQAARRPQLADHGGHRRSWRWCCRCWRRSIPPGALPGSIPSKRFATSRRRCRTAQYARPVLQLQATCAASSSRATARSSVLKGASVRPLSRPGGGAGRPVGRRQVDAAAHRRPARDAGRRPGLSSTGRTARSSATPSARACGASRWASSTSSTSCCRSSRRWRTW